MKNRNFNEGSHKRGYFIALFTCVLIVGVFAGINRNGSSSPKKDIPSKPQETSMAEEQPVESVSANKNAPPKISASAENAEIKNTNEVSSVPKSPVEETAKVETAKVQPQEKIEKDKDEPAVNEVFDEGVDSEETASFDNDLRLEWPVKGDIVMDYSTDKAIFDVTLEQYRTNDSVSIGAETGAQVKAAGEGIVEYVGNDSENGNTIVINHNNGWKTTYSQLQDGILVKEGEAVNVGQVIGGVGDPTKYSILLGSHLEFKVTRDDTTVDPKVALAE